jgi:hypothetical protein
MIIQIISIEMDRAEITDEFDKTKLSTANSPAFPIPLSIIADWPHP